MVYFIIHTILWMAALAALFWSAVTDFKTRIIPNEMVLLVALSGLALGLGLRPGQIWLNLLAALLVFLTLGILCHYRAIGGGDVKLTAALMLLVRPDRAGLLLAAIALAGGCLSCVYLAARAVLSNPARFNAPVCGQAERGRLHRWFKVERMRIAGSKPLPYALAILGGTVWYIGREVALCSSVTLCSF